MQTEPGGDGPEDDATAEEPAESEQPDQTGDGEDSDDVEGHVFGAVTGLLGTTKGLFGNDTIVGVNNDTLFAGPGDGFRDEISRRRPR